MLFIIDAQLPPGLVDFLKARGFEAQHVSRIGLGAAPDTEIWKRACDVGAMVMTKDEDFVTLATRSKSGPGVVWIRIGNCTNQSLRLALAPVLDEIIAALANGERLIEIR
jgi:predicted nuclease of predicted toxin-antitoxin system